MFGLSTSFPFVFIMAANHIVFAVGQGTGAFNPIVPAVKPNRMRKSFRRSQCHCSLGSNLFGEWICCSSGSHNRQAEDGVTLIVNNIFVKMLLTITGLHFAIQHCGVFSAFKITGNHLS